MPDDAIERARECLRRFMRADEFMTNDTMDRIVLPAMLAFASQQTPEGWVLVPREPTTEMLTAAMATSGMRVIDSILHLHQSRGYRIDESKFAPDNVAPLSQAWSAMLDAAPSVTLGEVG